jgi:hypothetical protein
MFAYFILAPKLFLKFDVTVEESIDVIFAEAPVAPRPDAVRFQRTLITPTSHGIDVNVQNPGDFAGRQHGLDLAVLVWHVLSSLKVT